MQGKVALVRADLNVPLSDGRVSDDTRISASLPTFMKVLDDGGGLVVMSHLGRPVEGQFDQEKSLAPVAKILAERLGRQVSLERLENAARPALGNVTMLENTRFNVGEKANDSGLARQYSSLGDVFVMDAFASAHRKEASTAALASEAADRCAGFLLAKEIDALSKAMENPARPVLAVVGGAKVSTKLSVLDRLAEIADKVAVGGGIANTFMIAGGLEVGKSLAEPTMAGTCSKLLASHPGKFILPTDVVVVPSIDSSAASIKPCGEIGANDCVGDLGPATVESIVNEVAKAGTTIWNGALGVFENDALSSGTRMLADAIASSPGFSLAGGGETVAAANQYGVADRISWLCTGGGAFLEFIEGKDLPGVAALG